MPSSTRQKAAERRREVYERRIAAARTLRARMNALVGWLMSETYVLPDEHFPHLHEAARALNERNRGRDSQ